MGNSKSLSASPQHAGYRRVSLPVFMPIPNNGIHPPLPHIFSISSPGSSRSLATQKALWRPAQSSLGNRALFCSLFNDKYFASANPFLNASLPSCFHTPWNKNIQRAALRPFRSRDWQEQPLLCLQKQVGSKTQA